MKANIPESTCVPGSRLVSGDKKGRPGSSSGLYELSVVWSASTEFFLS